jgi:antitoxin YefM
MVKVRRVYDLMKRPGKSNMTRHVPYAEFARHLPKYWDRGRKKPVRIKRSEDARVLMSEEEYEGLMETIHLLSSPANASRLRSALAQAKAGKLQEHELDE